MTTTKLTAEERAACETVERLLRELLHDVWHPAMKVEVTSSGAVIDAMCARPEYGPTIADAIERARADMSTP